MKKLMILVAALTLVASFALTAAAAEWNFYGSARMTTFSEDYDAPVGDGDRDTTWALQGNSRIGAKVKVSDTLSGGFEFGIGSSVSNRKIFGEWNFGAGKLLVGQTYTPACTYFYSNQVWGSDNDLLDAGQQYAGRKPMLRLTFGDFKIAFISPTTGFSTTSTADIDVTFPKIEVAYNLKMDNFFVDLSGGYQTYESNDEDIDSYLIALGGGMDFGSFYFNANIYYAENADAYGLLSMADDEMAFSRGEVVDNETLGYLLVAGFKVSDMLTVEAGYGAIEAELDADGADADEAQSYYINASITLAPGVYVIPEIGVRDYKDDAAGNDEGDMTYFGAKWQINF